MKMKGRRRRTAEEVEKKRRNVRNSRLVPAHFKALFWLLTEVKEVESVCLTTRLLVPVVLAVELRATRA